MWVCNFHIFYSVDLLILYRDPTRALPFHHFNFFWNTSPGVTFLKCSSRTIYSAGATSPNSAILPHNNNLVYSNHLHNLLHRVFFHAVLSRSEMMMSDR